jgi:hypothetical protein
MTNVQLSAPSLAARIVAAIKNLVVTTIAAIVFVVATVAAVTVCLLFAAMWYVFFATPVFGDLFGVLGRQAPATPPTTWTLVFVGAMALIAAAGCFLIFKRWNEWRRSILQKRRDWLGLA